MKKAMLSQPMAGKTDEEIVATREKAVAVLKAKGYETEIVNGIPSFCAVSAKLGDSLVDRSEQLHVIPSTYDIEDGLKLPGTKVLMKGGKKMASIRESIIASGQEAVMVENCGMENEKIHLDAEDIPSDASYFSLLIVKEKM